jgi:hypothetical protein
VKKITNGFKLLYQDLKALNNLRLEKQLAFRDFLAYRSPPKEFLQSKIYEKLNRNEIEMAKLTLRSLNKIGIFFILQAPPVIGLIPIFVALLFPRYILTKHFWNKEQTEGFFQQDWEERYSASMKLFSDFLIYERKEFKDSSFKSMLELRKLLFGSNLEHHSPFPYNLPLFHEKYFLCLLLQANGIFTNTLAIFCLPSFYLKRCLNQHVYEIINDDLILLKEEKLKNEQQANNNNNNNNSSNNNNNNTTIPASSSWHRSQTEMEQMKLQRGIYPFKIPPDYILYNQLWKGNALIESIKQEIIEKGDTDYANDFNYGKARMKDDDKKDDGSSGISAKELLLFRIAWNSLLDRSGRFLV